MALLPPRTTDHPEPAASAHLPPGKVEEGNPPPRSSRANRLLCGLLLAGAFCAAVAAATWLFLQPLTYVVLGLIAFVGWITTPTRGGTGFID